MAKFVSEYICEWVFDKTSIKIEGSEDLFTVGKLDSLLFAELVAAIENEFSTSVDFSALENWELIRTPIGLSEVVRF